MAGTKLLLITGEHLEVEGPTEDVAKALENAARSGVGTLAWLTETGTAKTLGVYPAHVVSVRQADE